MNAAEVCLYGMNIIMPLMTLELLKFPSLSVQYFRTLTLICEIYPQKICSLNPELQKNLILSLELGLSAQLGLDSVFVLCCDFIIVLCGFMVQGDNRNTPMFEAMRPFLKLMMDQILSQKINSDLVSNASSSLYVLICCYVVRSPNNAPRRQLNLIVLFDFSRKRTRNAWRF